MAWLNRLGEEHDNKRVALSWSILHDEVELALKLGGALRWFWNIAGNYSEGRSWLEAALGKEGTASAEARIKAVEGVGRLAVNQGDLERAEAAAEEGLELSRGRTLFARPIPHEELHFLTPRALKWATTRDLAVNCGMYSGTRNGRPVMCLSSSAVKAGAGRGAVWARGTFVMTNTL